MKRSFLGIISQTTHLFSKIFGCKKRESPTPLQKDAGLVDVREEGNAKGVDGLKTGYCTQEESDRIWREQTDPTLLAEKYKRQNEQDVIFFGSLPIGKVNWSYLYFVVLMVLLFAAFVSCLILVLSYPVPLLAVLPLVLMTSALTAALTIIWSKE